MRLGQRTLQRGNVELTRESRILLAPNAGVAELADALDSKSSDRKVVWVRAPPPANPCFTYENAFKNESFLRSTRKTRDERK